MNLGKLEQALHHLAREKYAWKNYLAIVLLDHQSPTLTLEILAAL
jgi:hypothetical protein